MKWPKIRIRRETIERTLIVCSAALVVLLSLKRGGTNGEPYEEPLGGYSARRNQRFKRTDGGYPKPLSITRTETAIWCPCSCSIMRQDGIAKATLELMVQEPENDHGRRAAGPCPRRAGRDNV